MVKPTGRRSTRIVPGSEPVVAAPSAAPVAAAASPQQQPASSSPRQAPAAAASTASAKKKATANASGSGKNVPRTTLSALEIAAEKKRLIAAAAAQAAVEGRKPAGAGKMSKAPQSPVGRQPAARTQSASVLLSGLTTDLSQIYSKAIGAFAGALTRGVPPPTVLRGTDSATLLFRTTSRHDAQQLWKRLDRTVVFGRKLRATYHPAPAVEPSPSPTAVDVTMSEPPLTLPQVEAVLATMPGLLAVTDGDAPNECLATFADEGTALHARAVLSGRRQDGAFLFLSIRRDVTLAGGPGVSSDDDDDDAPSNSDDDAPAFAPKSPGKSIAAARAALDRL